MLARACNVICSKEHTHTMNQQTHYFVAPVEVLDRTGFRLNASRAMISRQGIYRIFGESEALQKAFLDARIFTIMLDKATLQGRLVREQGEDGVHYNIRLINICERKEKYIDEQMKRIGFESPWKRQFPRLPVAKLPAHIEIPVTVAFPRMAGEPAAEVTNVSYKGMHFEWLSQGAGPADYVGQTIQFHLVTNRGTIFSDVEAKVARIYDEMVRPGKLVRGLGVKFGRFELAAQKRYQEMVLQATKAVGK